MIRSSLAAYRAGVLDPRPSLDSALSDVEAAPAKT